MYWINLLFKTHWKFEFSMPLTHIYLRIHNSIVLWVCQSTSEWTSTSTRFSYKNKISNIIIVMSAGKRHFNRVAYRHILIFDPFHYGSPIFVKFYENVSLIYKRWYIWCFNYFYIHNPIVCRKVLRCILLLSISSRSYW